MDFKVFGASIMLLSFFGFAGGYGYYSMGVPRSDLNEAFYSEQNKKATEARQAYAAQGGYGDISAIARVRENEVAHTESGTMAMQIFAGFAALGFCIFVASK